MKRKEMSCYARTMAVIFTAMCCACFCLTACFAAPSISEGWGDGIARLYNNIAKPIATALAAFAIAIGGMQFFGLSVFSMKNREDRMEKGKKIVILAAVALVAIWFLPKIFSLAFNLFGRWTYTPPTPPST